MSVPEGYKLVPIKPTIEQMRALLVSRGYDPDADDSTLDDLGRLDLMTMGTYLKAYEVMVLAASEVT